MRRNLHPIHVENSHVFCSIPLIQSIRYDGVLETGEPLAGTERNEVSAKNNGIWGSERGIVFLILDFLSGPFFHHSIIPLFH